MPAKAGIQKRFPEALDSRVRGNDKKLRGNDNKQGAVPLNAHRGAGWSPKPFDYPAL
jgi:hypothetical protein